MSERPRVAYGPRSSWRSSSASCFGIGVIVALPISGGSFNAARSLGPMIVSAQYPGWWMYIVAPTLSGVLGALCYEYLTRSGAPPE